MSKIIKGGKTKVFNFFLPEEKEENFSAFCELLPEEAWQEIERKRAEQQKKHEQIDQENVSTIENNVSSEEIITEEENKNLPEETESEAESFDISQLSIEDLRAHPEVSQRIALIEQEAYEKGFAQGQKDGEALAKKQYETLTTRVSALLKNLEKTIEEHVLSLEPQLILLVKTIVSQIVQREVALNAEVVKASLREALLHVVEQTRVKIHLHPDDMEFLDDILNELRGEISKLKDFEIVPDANLQRGGCLLETDFGLVDATLERRFRKIFARLDREGS
ncbi:FliH/SctL family protein [Thermodesulfatator atlanticus]|uniref:FliH/SctL family protein n=2 Tax=Thermodesulfatator atlanticus TaxID=501497 RepID=UPI0003B5A46A|nr:FliH/SctL family protein [Thermodesulfatator atlanticus]